MALIGRLSGALLAQTGEAFYLVGDLKEPCDFPAAGFQTPPILSGATVPFIQLSPLREVELKPPFLSVDVEGEPLAVLLHARLVIQRNGSVSERLWRLITQFEKEPRTDARWFAQMPASVWNLVRDAVLKCS